MNRFSGKAGLGGDGFGNVCISGVEQVVSKFLSLVCAHNPGICHGSAAFSSLNIEFP